MQRIYQIWQTYAMFVVDVLSAYCKRTEDIPLFVSLGALLVPMVAADFFLPRWASLSIYVAIGLPLAWFLGTMFVVFYTYRRNRTNH